MDSGKENHNFDDIIGATNPSFDDGTGEGTSNLNGLTGKDNPGFDYITDEPVHHVEDDFASSNDTDDASSDGDELNNQEITSGNSEISETDLSENEINTEKRVSFKDTKGSKEPKENLFAKLETFRKPYYSVLGKRCTCNNIRYFVIVFSIIVFLRSCVSSYLYMVSYEVGRRYYNNRYEMDFITGVERIGVVITLIFTSYYGNKFFKPISILCGAVLCGIGAIISALPYVILKERQTNHEDDIPPYIQAGLCQSGIVTNTSYSEQCMQHPAISFPEENKGSFSLFCTAHFFIGIGTAFLLPGGIVYTVEAEKPSENPLYLGLFVASYGLGQLIGSLFGVWFIKYPENLSGEIAINDWHTGAWWLGFPIFGSLLIVVPFALLVFPRWIREPKWLLYRKYRHKLKLDRWKKREQEARRERRRKKREKLRKERERKKIKEKNKQSAATGDVQADQSVTEETSAKDKDGVFQTIEDEGCSEVRNGLKELNSNADVGNDETNSYQNGNAVSSKTSTDNNGKNDPKSGEDISMDDLKASTKEASSSGTRVDGMDSQSTVERKSLYKKHSQRKQVRISQTSKTSEKEEDKSESKDEQLSPAQLKRKRTMEKNINRHKLGRRLQDLPKNLKFLVKKPMFLLTVLGAALSLYFQTGFYPTLHRYFHIQFQYSYKDSTMIAGVIFGLGMLLGALVSSVAIYKLKMPLKRQFLVNLVIQAVTLIMVMILMALGCEVQQGPTHQTDLGLQTTCAPACDCSLSQLSRVCIEDGSVSYVSPCHAGCRLAHVDEESQNNLHYTECTCEASKEVAPEWCDTRCPSAAGFIVCCLVAVVTQSMAFVTIILLMIQSHPEKLRSLNIGFSFWIIYIIAVVPGVAVYTYFYTTSCSLHGINCQEDEECWSSNVTKYRYITAGATLAFLAVGLAILIGAYFVFRKVNKTSKTPASKVPDKSKIQLTKDVNRSTKSSDVNTNGASNIGFTQEESV